MHEDRIKLEDLAGETLTAVDIFDGDEIILTTQSGRRVKIFHDQDCCESVGIEGPEGDWTPLLGKVLLECKQESESFVRAYGTGTKTTLTFRVDDATVVSRWIGESNGYYSEEVHIAELRG